MPSRDPYALSQPEDPHAGDAGIWAPHPDRVLRAHVEDCHRRLADALRVMEAALAPALLGVPVRRLAKAQPWSLWDHTALAEVRRRLERTPPGRYSLADWLLLVDALLAQILPPDALESEAERLALRADLLGRLQALLPAGEPPGDAAMQALTAALPASLAALPRGVLDRLALEEIGTAAARAGIALTDVTEALRSGVKRLVVSHVAALRRGLGDSGTLERRLRDAFGDANRDWRRIAISETGEVANCARVSVAGAGARLRRVEAYSGACEFCAGLSGKVFTVVPDDHPDKDGETMVWPSKDNIGRSAARRKWVNGTLVERPPEERLWAAAGIMHPSCRGSWVPVPGDRPPPNVSPEFAAWLDGMIRSAGLPGR
jgi:hypothetical protein